MVKVGRSYAATSTSQLTSRTSATPRLALTIAASSAWLMSALPSSPRLTPCPVGLSSRRHALLEHDWEGLRVVHFRVLGVVPAEGTTISALAEPLRMTKQAAGQFVAQLEQSEHLELRVDERDRRCRVVVRTGRGDQLVARVDAAVAELERGWAHQLGEQRHAVFCEALMELVRS